MRLRSATVAVAVLALISAGSVGAAAGGGTVQLTPVPSKFPDRTFAVTLPKEVALKPGLIRVRENGELIEKVAITPMGGATGGDFGAVLLIDASTSMKGAAIEGATKAARAFAERRKPNQKLSLASYNDTTEILLPFTTDKRRIDEALSAPPEIAYWTRMFDAIEEVVSVIRTEQLQYSAIVLLSDGQELGSSSTLEAATAAAREAGVRIFSVALMSRFFDSSTLKSLASRTGGEYFEASSPNALVGIYRRLGTQLANEYLLQYKSFAGPDELVSVHVSVAAIDAEGEAGYRSPKLPINVLIPAPIAPSALDKIVQSGLTMLLLAFLLASMLTATVLLMVRPRSSGVLERLGTFVAVAKPAETKRQTAALSERLLVGTERSLNRTRWWARFKEELEIGEISMAAEQVVVLTFLSTILLAWAFSIFVSPLAVLLALLTPLAVRMFVRFRADRQRRAFADQLPDNLQVLSAALRAGHSLIGALSVVVEDAPEPSRREFRRLVADEQLGVPLDEGFTTIAARMRNRDLDQVALVAALQRETGANSAEVLDRVADTVRERAALRRLVRTLTAQGRMARWIVSALPVGLLVIISILNPDYMKPLVNRTAGQLMLVVAALMVIAGSLVIKRIVNIRI
jgi:tight adherence protein B